MSKRDELIEKYAKDLKEKCKVANPDYGSAEEDRHQPGAVGLQRRFVRGRGQ